ncbi:hypothetical protein [Alsobacter sp. R-9]
MSVNRPAAVLILVAATGLAGCSSLGLGSDDRAPATSTASSSSSSFTEFFRNGGSTTPPPALPENTDVECPQVEILDGGAAIRVEGGGAVRHQLSLGQTARECRVVGNQISIRVGVEGRALLGPSGSPGTFPAPVRFVVKRGEKVVASKLQRPSVTIPAGDTQASFVVIEEGLLVPKEGEEMAIIVGFDPKGTAVEAPRRKPRG